MLIFYKNKLHIKQNHTTTIIEVNKALKMVQLITTTAERETKYETVDGVEEPFEYKRRTLN